MHKRIGMLVFFAVLALTGYAQQTLAEDAFTFRTKESVHPDGYEYGASIICLFNDEGTGKYEVLMQGYDSRGIATNINYPKLFICLDKLQLQIPLNPICSNEWETLDGTYKGFVYEPPSTILTLLMPVILAAGQQEYKIQSTDKVRKGFYSASITCLNGRWWRLGRSYSDLPIPIQENQPLVFQALDSMELPVSRSCSTEWETYQDQWVWFQKDSTLLYP